MESKKEKAKGFTQKRAGGGRRLPSVFTPASAYLSSTFDFLLHLHNPRDLRLRTREPLSRRCLKISSAIVM